jgi:hypothetical protein
MIGHIRRKCPAVVHHLTGRPSLANDLRLRSFAHRTELNNYGSEGWGFAGGRHADLKLYESGLLFVRVGEILKVTFLNVFTRVANRSA